MPSELFGPAWPTVLDVADVTATAPDYAGIAYLACAASLIGGKRWVSAYGDWAEPCILWTAALGDPSSRKSAPLDRMTKPLWKIQQNARLDYDLVRREWQAEIERAKAERAKWQDEVKGAAGGAGETPPMPVLAVEPEEPQERRPIVSDVTPEAAAIILKGNPQGVLCYNDELAGWLESFERYTTGGRPFWLAAHGGKPHNITRKGSGSIDLRFTGISVLGSIQPDKIVELLAGANDGLVPRILWAWPEKMPPRRPSAPVSMAALERAYERLEMLQWGRDAEGREDRIVLRLTGSAADLFHEWELENAASDGDGGSLYEAFAGKMSGAALRLALVCEMTEWAFGNGAEPAEVSKQSVAAAIKWVENYAKPMAHRVYGDAAVSVADRNAALLARYVRKHRFETVNLRELRQHPHKQHLKPLQAKGALDEAVEVMVDAGWLLPAFQRDGETKGQPRKDYRVNPAVLGDR
ncbi:YfjI family protein [Tsuneonella sp. YG55]|uniref:YfjI family protein n=2 Tax=Tsuneonella litorea TaxID=2976475 RepID=A0A9X2W1E2_9SPHN|nr:YfjI family protein [Tsuneonella litorea]